MGCRGEGVGRVVLLSDSPPPVLGEPVLVAATRCPRENSASFASSFRPSSSDSDSALSDLSSDSLSEELSLEELPRGAKGAGSSALHQGARAVRQRGIGRGEALAARRAAIGYRRRMVADPGGGGGGSHE